MQIRLGDMQTNHQCVVQIRLGKCGVDWIRRVWCRLDQEIAMQIRFIEGGVDSIMRYADQSGKCGVDWIMKVWCRLVQERVVQIRLGECGVDWIRRV